MYRYSHKQKITLATDSCSEGDFDKRGFAEDRIKAVREMICARTVEEREAALAKVEPFQQGDFEAMYRIY